MSPKKTRTSGGPFEALRELKEALEKKERDASQAKSAAPAPRTKVPKAAAIPAPARAEHEDEALSFHRLFAGVQPIDRSRAGRMAKEGLPPSALAVHAASQTAAGEQAEKEAVHARLRALVDATARFEVTDDGEHVEGRRVDVPWNDLRRLRRGAFPIDDRLDLHGLKARDAQTRLESFLRAARTRGERCVLVIHGRGQHSPGGVAVLRGEVSAWLSQDAASAHVAAFATAKGDDGGHGATYVMLRR